MQASDEKIEDKLVKKNNSFQLQEINTFFDFFQKLALIKFGFLGPFTEAHINEYLASTHFSSCIDILLVNGSNEPTKKRKTLHNILLLSAPSF
jgi:hypothetical protein